MLDKTKEDTSSSTFQIEDAEEANQPTTGLTYHEVADKLAELGKLHDELRDGKYVEFTMSGKNLAARIFKSRCVGEYVRK